MFDAAKTEGRAGTPVFGLRLQQHSFAFFSGKLAKLHPQLSGEVERIHAEFGRTVFMHLTRTDKVAQAVSREIAQQSGLWHRAADGSELERLAPPRKPVYHAAKLAEHVAELNAADRAWEEWFEKLRISPLRLTYDRLSADPLSTLGVALGHLGIGNAAAAGIRPGTAKLADNTSAEWIERFRRESGL